MASPYSIGTNVLWLTMEAAESEATSFPTRDQYAHSMGVPAAGNGIFALQGLPETTAYALKFFATGGAEKTATVRVWGLSVIAGTSSPTEYIGIYFGEVALVTGTKTSNSGVFSGATHYFVKSISITEDATPAPPGLRVIGADAADASATLLVPTLGVSVLMVAFEQVGANPVSTLGIVHRGL